MYLQNPSHTFSQHNNNNDNNNTTKKVQKKLKKSKKPVLWGVNIILMNDNEIAVRCPTHDIALYLSQLLLQNNVRVRRPERTVLTTVV